MNTEPNTLKIAFDAKRLFLNKAGLGNYSRWLVSGIIHQCPQNQYHLYTPEISEIENFYKGENIHTHLPPNFFKNFWRTKGIKKDLLKDKIDIYHGLSNELPIGIEKTGIKTVVTIHDLIFKLYPEYYKPIDRLIYNQKFRSACERADKIVAVSKHTKECIVEFYKINPEKIEIIYQDSSKKFHSSADIKKVKEVKEKYALTKPFFLNVGNIGGRKNQYRLVEAFATIYNKIEHDLLFIGKKDKSWLEFNSIIQKYDLDNRIKLIDYVSDDDLLNIYRASYATVYPSFYEGFGIPIIESFRSGRPVLTSSGSSLEEIAGKAGLLCNPKNMDSIANGLLKLTDSKTYQQLFQNIEMELARFQPSILIAQYAEIYKNLRSFGVKSI